jgi:serine/threonine protein kinase
LTNESKKCVQCGSESGPGDDLCLRCRTEVTIESNQSPASGEKPTLAEPHTGSARGQGGDSHKLSSVECSDFGDYELLEEIARGGMGVVYKARHKKLNRIAAVKVILGGRFSSTADVQRFHVEAAAAQLDHTGIVPVYEIGNHAGLPFFAMKFVAGGSLAEHLDRIAEHPRRMVEFMVQVAQAVHHAHQRGILHRDIKPANILLSEDDSPLLTDLGLAKDPAGCSMTKPAIVLVCMHRISEC